MTAEDDLKKMQGINWSDKQLKAAGISKRKLKTLMRKFGECVVLMAELKLSVYAESGEGNLIHESRPDHVDGKADLGSVVARIGFGFDGGGW